MMSVLSIDPDDSAKLMALSEEVAEIYNKYIDSPYLRKALNLIDLDPKDDATIVNFQRMVSAHMFYEFDFFYEVSLALAKFCDKAYFNVAPGISKSVLNASEVAKLGLSPSEQSLCKILVDSFPENIKSLAKKVDVLYQFVIDIDSKINSKRPLYTQYKGIEQIDALLYPILANLGAHLN